jgi:hypothetical protein
VLLRDDRRRRRLRPHRRFGPFHPRMTFPHGGRPTAGALRVVADGPTGDALDARTGRWTHCKPIRVRYAALPDAAHLLLDQRCPDGPRVAAAATTRHPLGDAGQRPHRFARTEPAGDAVRRGPRRAASHPRRGAPPCSTTRRWAGCAFAARTPCAGPRSRGVDPLARSLHRWARRTAAAPSNASPTSGPAVASRRSAPRPSRQGPATSGPGRRPSRCSVLCPT